jgi:putative FmdB family regulatory protein
MPIYEYACRACGRVFSVLQASYLSTAPACPSCGSAEVSKKVSSFSCRSGFGSAGGPSGGSFPSGGT